MFEDCEQELDRLREEEYLETLLLDISSPELNEPILQPGARSMDMETSLLDINLVHSTLFI